MAGVRVVVRDNQGRICLVHHGYGARDWNVPGGGVEQSESILDAGAREVMEETGRLVRLTGFVGLYSIPDTSDLTAVLLGEIDAAGEWSSNREVSEWQFFSTESLPEPIHPCVRACIDDAITDRTGLLRVMNSDGTLRESIE